MSWRILYGLRSFLRSSLWVVPFIAIPFELIITRLVHGLDASLGWNFLGFAFPGAQSLLQATITATLSFVVFTFGSLLVAIQVASAQLTPRIIATTLLRNGVVKYTVGLFIFTLMFAISAQNKMEKDVHQLVMLVAALLTIFCFAAFLYLIDYAARLLRPISILALVCKYGLAVIESVYPDPNRGSESEAGKSFDLGSPDRVIRHVETSGIVLAVNLRQLMDEASRADGIIEFVPQVGDFVAHGDPLFRIHPGSARVNERALYYCVAFGYERTLEQDPAFAFRIMVDIASRALSPAVNDPTTAVLAIDQIHRLLAHLGQRDLDTGPMRDAHGQVRLVYATPNWEDFVTLAVSEIRSFGAGSIQIPRRLSAMFEHLLEVLPASRAPAVRRELSLLERAVDRQYVEDEDRESARDPDRQGLGGSAASATHTSD